MIPLLFAICIILGIFFPTNFLVLMVIWGWISIVLTAGGMILFALLIRGSKWCIEIFGESFPTANFETRLLIILYAVFLTLGGHIYPAILWIIFGGIHETITILLRNESDLTPTSNT